MDDQLEQRNSELLEGVYNCVDRIVLNGYCSLATSPGGFRTWWRQLFGTDDNLDNNQLMRLAGRFSRRLRSWAVKHGIPVIDATSGDNKCMHRLVEPHRPVDPEFTGVFCISISRAPVWRARRLRPCGRDRQRISENAFAEPRTLPLSPSEGCGDLAGLVSKALARNVGSEPNPGRWPG
jgi:hypothetical protein